jgi:hypothetical protein
VLAALIVSLTASRICAGTPVGYEAYTAWEDWARLHLGFKSDLASSYDRDGGGDDYSQYESPPGLITGDVNAIIKTIEGPGVIYRFWMPHAMARRYFVVRMFFDGEVTPRIDTNSTAIMNGAFSYFSAPLITTFAGGQVCYEPIPFAQSLRIETRNKKLDVWANQHYYQYSYHTFPEGATIDSYTGQLMPQQEQARSEAVSLFNNVGQHPAGSSPTAVDVNVSAIMIGPDSSITLASLTSPGLIRKLNIRMNDANDAELGGLRLQVLYDGQQTPAIDVSIAHFFGAGKERTAYRSIPLGTNSTDPNEGFYCYWPMPFHQSVLVQLYNTTDEPIFVDLAKIEYETKDIDRNMCYLHAVENTSIKQSGQIYHTLLSTTGRGHYVGDLLYVEQDANSFWMLEGDDVITVDGTMTQYGTGLEDAYNGGAYYNWVAPQGDEPEGVCPQSAIRPLNGILYVNKKDFLARADQYRWRIADCIPFSRSIEVNVECRYGITGSRWTSVGFWYQLPFPLEDLNDDRTIDLADFAIFAQWWLESNCGDCGKADLTGDSQVKWDDLREFTSNWLAGIE